MVSWSKQFLLEFIELFKSQEPVWYIKSKDYYNKGKRNECYDLLLTKIQSVDPTANRDTVTKKINNLRSSFRKEFKKVTVSKVSGASADDIYKPKLWYYNELLFLKDQEEPLDSTSNIDDDNDIVPFEEHTQDSGQSPDTPRSVSQLSLGSSSTKSFKRKQPDTYSDAVLRIVGDRLATVRQEDEYDVVGKNVAAKMRSLDPEQKIYAEKIINDALYEAQLKNLSRYSRLHNPESNEISAKRQPTITNQTPQTYQTYAFPQANQTYAPPQINVVYAPA